MNSMITLGILVVALAFLVRNAISERNMYHNQRDALLNLLDSEGRGKEAVEIIKCYR